MSYRSIILFILLLFANFALVAQKNDTIVLVNNNILTGEIKNLEYGLLTFKTDAMGTLSVKAEELKSLKSNKRFQIQLSNGFVYFGSFDTVNGRGAKVRVITSSNYTYIVEIKEIIEISPFREKFWSRVSGQFSVGGNYSKSSGLFNYNTSGNLKYWGRKRYVNLAWTNNFAWQNDSVVTNKQSSTAMYKHYLRNHFNGEGSFDYSKNLELGLLRRLSLNLVLGKDINHRYRSFLNEGRGITAGTELKESDTISHLTFEGVMQVTFEIFKRTHPQLTIKLYFYTYPSLTIRHRWRFNSQFDIQWEVFHNFYLGLQFYDDFDNQPQANILIGDQVQKNDWGITGTLGYSFH
jgi:hypothetical protein